MCTDNCIELQSCHFAPVNVDLSRWLKARDHLPNSSPESLWVCLQWPMPLALDIHDYLVAFCWSLPCNLIHIRFWFER